MGKCKKCQYICKGQKEICSEDVILYVKNIENLLYLENPEFIRLLWQIFVWVNQRNVSIFEKSMEILLYEMFYCMGKSKFIPYICKTTFWSCHMHKVVNGIVEYRSSIAARICRESPLTKVNKISLSFGMAPLVPSLVYYMKPLPFIE